jgi:hypothetical protein
VGEIPPIRDLRTTIEQQLMPNTVFFLGAGASKQAGAPLMADFLDRAHDLWKSGRVSKHHNDFERVFSAIAALQVVHSKSKLDLNNIEVVFSAFEMARVLQRFPERDAAGIHFLIEAIKNVIVVTLQESIRFPVERGAFLEAPPPYRAFATLLNQLTRESLPLHHVSVLTFNYDICVEVAFHFGEIPFEYGFITEADRTRVLLLKLHGSLNWTRRTSDQQLIAYPIDEYLGKAYLSPMQRSKSVTIPIGTALPDLQLSDPEVDGTAVLVAPTPSKGESHRLLSDVWASAARELADAENIFISGYSMPATDSFFHYLYALGTAGRTPLKRFWVFDPDSTGLVEARFRDLLGPGAESRFRFVRSTFESAINEIAAEFPGRRS